MKEQPSQIFRKLLAAKPLTRVPDRARIKWRKRKWRLPKGKTTCVPKTRRPPKEKYYVVLENDGTDLKHCELCDSDYKIIVHHKDGNPYNQKRQNLQVLCQHCHSFFHGIIEEGVHHEFRGNKSGYESS